MTILNAKDQTRIRAGATRSVLQKTDRILGQSHVRVKIENSQVPAPAYTDGEVITISASMDPIKSALANGFTPKTMMLATALNYHELAHVMFTPRLRSKLAKRVRDEGMFMSFNILEDQAAETRFVQLYEPARHYFTSLVTNYMMDNQQYLEANYVLVSGRLFLPQRFRKSFRDNFHKPELIADIDRLVSEYKTLAWPDDEQRMYSVIKEFHELLAETQPSTPGTPHDSIKNGTPDSGTTRRLTKEDEFVNEEDDEESSGSSASKDEESEEEKDTKGKDKSEDESEESEDGPGEGDAPGSSSDDSDSDDGEDEPEDGEPEPESGGQGGSAQPHAIDEKPEPPSKKELEQAIKDAMDEALHEAMEEVEEELDNRIDAVKNEESNYTVDQEVVPSRTRDPSPEETFTVSRCVNEFREVEMQRAPGWNMGTRSGKLDPRRYAKAMYGGRDVYKRWREGVNDMLDFEVVFLLDQSGSMSRSMDAASASLWILKRTFEECNGVVTALGFSTGVNLLNQRFDPSSPGQVPVYRALSSTYVTDAMKEAKRILSTSIKPLRMCVVISDGGFHDSHFAMDEVDHFGNSMVFIGINHDVSHWSHRRNVVHTQTIRHPTELVDVIKNLALRLSEERLTKKGLA